MTHIAILTPTYHRSHFIEQYIHQLKKQTYPHQFIHIFIDDDGYIPFIQDIDNVRQQLYPMKLTYIQSSNKRNVGQKRNSLVKRVIKDMGVQTICINVDDDDYQNEDRIRAQVTMIQNQNLLLVGSKDCIIVYPLYNWIMALIKCDELAQIHEGTMAFVCKLWISNGGFSNISKAEGYLFVELSPSHKISHMDIGNLLVCVAHQDNTVNKDYFKDMNVLQFEWSEYDKAIIQRSLDLRTTS